MKKTRLFLLILLSLMVLGGCVGESVNQVASGKEKIEYTAKATSITLTSSQASLRLYDLYQSPLAYGTPGWEEDFYANKKTVDDGYEEAKKMNVPQGMEESHQKLLSVLRETTAVNDKVERGLKTGEKLTGSVVKEFAEVVELYRSVTSLFQ